MKEKIMYLVPYIGMYRYCNEPEQGDHSYCLFKTKKEAINYFRKAVKDCKSYYKEELDVKFKTWYDSKNYSFSLRTISGDDSVDIHIQEIKCDGTHYQMVF